MRCECLQVLVLQQDIVMKTMKYLVICVFAACTTFGLVQSNEELDKEQPDGPFSCPVCEEKVNPGKDADTACDENIRNQTCPGEDPVCMLYKRFSGSQVEFIDRHCYSREGYDRVKGYCDKPGKNCAIAMCDSSGCKAELITTNSGNLKEPLKPVKQPDGPFRCPVCTIEGRDAQLQSCDNNIKDEICMEEDPVCMLGQFFDGSPFRFKRHCYNRENFNYVKASCEADDPTECVVAMCDTSGCKA
ncbi:hypothetical protein OS493_030927 [Desmophyllum pertusum]|uniref:Uncharacterized protein n=1 Tax=Desmophyllum pertusum TaxID=174260 RepID=A0A9W9ZX82_9CNID|nr:hypothetical protein OS493_030927 [Desmophyllum pertusum]